MQVYIIEATRKNCERHQKLYSKPSDKEGHARGPGAESSTRNRKAPENIKTHQVGKSALRRSPEGDRKALWNMAQSLTIL